MSADSADLLASTLVDAQVDLNPHQVEAASFAFCSPLSTGVILADELKHASEVLPTAKLVINPEYDASMLAATLCGGLTCAPSEALWQQQAYNGECSLMGATTQTLRAEQLQALSNEVSNERSPPVCRAAYRAVTAAQAADCWLNLTINKALNMAEDRCDRGHADHSINVAELSMARLPAAELAAQVEWFSEAGL